MITGSMQREGTWRATLRATYAALTIVLASAALCLATAGPAAAITPKALLRSCEAVVAGSRVRQVAVLDVPRTGLPCWYFMSAVQNMSVLIDQSGEPLLGICAPENTRLLDYVRTFVRYARRVPRGGQENAAALAVEALNATYPCGHRDTASLRLP
jgi:Rap1a immunity proteins